jgi:hypothetical protein
MAREGRHGALDRLADAVEEEVPCGRDVAAGDDEVRIEHVDLASYLTDPPPTWR